MLSLVTFRITFTNQITVVQQRLAITTGNTITAASLGLQLVTITGELAPAVDLDWGWVLCIAATAQLNILIIVMDR